jgi:chromosome segregation ATPase
MALPGLDETKALEEKIESLRAAYASKKAELDLVTRELAEIERSGKLARERLNLLRSRAA